MELVFLILVCLFVWWLANASSGSGSISHGLQTGQYRDGVTQEPSVMTSRRAGGYGPSNSRQPYVLRRPVGDCICGCNGVPLTHLPEYSIDYDKYKICPARLRRKRTGTFTDDSGRSAVWKSAPQRRTQKARTKREIERRQRDEEKRKQSQAQERQKHLLRLAKEEQEKIRHEKGAPAISASEALRRGLDTYIGKKCAIGHPGERHVRNGECVECRRIDQRKRDAMRRGAYPRDLTPAEKKRIGEIYAEARRLTNQTGIEHHVDHIKPLAAGGEHHPDNLRVVTAEENLKKGASWEDDRTL